jgi:hypothetical protein
MKISTKFLSSSISLGILIVTLVGSAIFWTRFQEDKFEEKKADIFKQTEQISQLNSLLDEQIIALKDYLVLDKNPEAMKNYRQFKSEVQQVLMMTARILHSECDSQAIFLVDY